MIIRGFKAIMHDNEVKFAYVNVDGKVSLKNIALEALAQEIWPDVDKLRKESAEENSLDLPAIDLFPLHSIIFIDGKPVRCIALSCSEQNNFWKSFNECRKKEQLPT